MINRTSRAALAQETLKIIDEGCYTTPSGTTLDIQKQVNACLGNTQHFSPEDLDVILKRVLQSPAQVEKTTFELQNETTLQGAQRLALSGKYQTIVALNFASAKNPGGGFLSGSQAQEESLARSSALYSSLLKAQDYYEYHRNFRSSLYSHRMILSPECPVFRDDSGNLLTDPYTVTFITSAAPNAGATQQNYPQEMPHLPTVFQERAARVLALAVDYGANALVLGAWGCGVFKNDPVMVAEIFCSLLQPGGEFANRFPLVLFSVLDTSKTMLTYEAFHQGFATLF